ncbi:unnamed protein product, partial [Effrenium voratum]
MWARPNAWHWGWRVLGARHFAKRRQRLDEYEHYDRPLSSKAWKRLKSEGSFFEYSFQDMTAGEVSETLFLASKMSLENPDFWSRGSLALQDLASAMTPRQLTAACWAFGAVRWHDPAFSQLSSCLVQHAATMQATHLATVAQAFARMKLRSGPVLQALSSAAEEATASGKLNGKGLAMIAGAFAELEFRCPRFLRTLDAWAVDGVLGMRLDVCLDLFSSLALLTEYQSPGRAAAKELAETLALKVRELEASQLHTATLAMGKLRIDQPEVIRAFQKEILAELNSLHANSLPPVLESFSLCFAALQSREAKEAKEAKDAQSEAQTDVQTQAHQLQQLQQAQQEREFFLAQLAMRVARELRLLRPQDASRALQAIDRLGLVEPRLLVLAAELVPQRLAQWPAAQVLSLLEAYARAQNADGFMVPCLRRALLSTEAMCAMCAKCSADAEGSALDDLQMVRAAQAFASLQHPAGIVALALKRPAAPSCQLALASLAMGLDSDTWKEATHRLLEQAKEQIQADTLEALSVALAQAEGVKAASDSRAYQADDVLMAILAFPLHPSRSGWCHALATRMSECSLALLPGFLLSVRSRPDESPQAAGLALPPAAVVATFRALAQLQARRARAEARRVILGATLPLIDQLAILSDEDQLSAKASVRVLQSMKAGLIP